MTSVKTLISSLDSKVLGQDTCAGDTVQPIQQGSTLPTCPEVPWRLPGGFQAALALAHSGGPFCREEACARAVTC